jgi:hypothetical protein
VLDEFLRFATILTSVTPQPPESLLSGDITIVTAFFNIGDFGKGSKNNKRGPETYHKWMSSFNKLLNPVIFFLETDEDIDMIRQLRNHLPSNITKIVRFDRSSSWSFGLQDRIAEIFNQSSYPKHYPNTVEPDYSCAMHAKYDCMLSSVTENPFHTRYFAWMDIGYFRTTPTGPFKLALPPNFNESRLAITEVSRKSNAQSAKDLIHGNLVWVAGGFFLAQRDVMLQWIEDYQNAAQLLLAHDLMSTDQQVIYSMFVRDNFGFRAKTELQRYMYNGHWFHLGYECKREGDKLMAREKSTSN